MASACAGLAPHLLDVQYRMHPLIAAFPSQQFYAGKLQTGITAEERPLPRGAALFPPLVQCTSGCGSASCCRHEGHFSSCGYPDLWAPPCRAS